MGSNSLGNRGVDFRVLPSDLCISGNQTVSLDSRVDLVQRQPLKTVSLSFDFYDWNVDEFFPRLRTIIAQFNCLQLILWEENEFSRSNQ